MALLDPTKSGLSGHGYQDSDSKFTSEELTILSISKPRDIESKDGKSHSKVNVRIKGLGTFWLFADGVSNLPDWIPSEGMPAKVTYKLTSYEGADGTQHNDVPSINSVEFQTEAKGLNAVQLDGITKRGIPMFA